MGCLGIECFLTIQGDSRQSPNNHHLIDRFLWCPHLRRLKPPSIREMKPLSPFPSHTTNPPSRFTFRFLVFVFVLPFQEERKEANTTATSWSWDSDRGRGRKERRAERTSQGEEESECGERRCCGGRGEERRSRTSAASISLDIHTKKVPLGFATIGILWADTGLDLRIGTTCSTMLRAAVSNIDRLHTDVVLARQLSVAVRGLVARSSSL